MSGFYNPSTPETVGLEWAVDSEPGSVVLDSATKAFGHRFPGVASKVSESIAVYCSAISGEGVFGCELYSDYSPRVPVPQTRETKYAGTDTGSDFTSPYNGNAAWVTAGGGAASYASVSPGVADVTYLKNVNQLEGPTPARLMIRGAANAATAQLAGKRILSVEVHVVVKSTLSTTPIFAGNLNLGGTDYTAKNVAIPINVGYTDQLCGYWELNPQTGLPWTLEQINNIVTAGSTDEFGCLASWNASYTANYADTIRVMSVYLILRTQPEDRVGYAYGTVDSIGWQPWLAKSVPNLLSKQDSNLEVDTGSTGSWVAGSNTTLTNDTIDPGAPWTRSLKLDPTAAGDTSALLGFYPCIAGVSYAARAYLRSTAGTGMTVSLLFYDANGNLLQTSTSPSATGDAAFHAAGMTAAVVAPLGTTQFKVRINLAAAAGTDTSYAAGIFVGIDQAALNYVRDSYPGALTKIKVDGAAEVSEVSRAIDELDVFRRFSGTGAMSMPKLPAGASAVGMPLDQESRTVTLQDGAGAILTIADVATPVTAIVSTSLHNWDSANGPQAAYSQPYAARIPGLVYTGNTIESEMTLPGTTFVAFRLVVAGQVDVPAAPLTLKLKRRSDNAQAGGTATINPTDLERIIPPGGGPASRATPQVFIIAIPTPAANTAAQYYVEAASTAALGSGWVLYTLDDLGYSGDSVSADTVIFGAGTDAWTDPANGGENTHRNGMIMVQTKPVAPANVTATVVDDHIDVEWDPTALGVMHEATEVWVSNDRAAVGAFPGDGFGYQQVADLVDESEVLFSHVEPRRGVDAVYMVRLRRTDGSYSDFSTPTAAVHTPSTGVELLFVSGEAPFSMYVEGTGRGDITWEPPDERVIMEFSGRPGAVAFLPIEEPYDEWDREVMLYWTGNLLDDCGPGEAPVGGRGAFNPLERLTRASLSYVCVLDRDGNRWFASVALKTATQQSDGGYIGTLHLRELTRVPSTPTTSPA